MIVKQHNAKSPSGVTVLLAALAKWLRGGRVALIAIAIPAVLAGSLLLGTSSAFATATAPIAFATGAQQITESSAVLVGNVMLGESEIEWHLEYASREMGPWTRIAPGGTLPVGVEGEFHEVEAEATGLTPDTLYYFRITATNAAGTTVNPEAGSAKYASFESYGPPTVQTPAAHALDVAGVRALGAVTPHGFDTHYHFQYVTQSHFEREGFTNPTNAPELDAGSVGDAVSSPSIGQPVLVGQDLAGLEPGATYHVRLQATSEAAGHPAVTGNEQTLTVPPRGTPETPACPNQALRLGTAARLPDCRAYEQLTPAEKGGAQDAFGYGSFNEEVQVGEDGDHLALTTIAKWGSETNSGSQGTYVFSRTPAGWQMQSAAATQPAARQDNYATQIFTPDLSQLALDVSWIATLTNTSPEEQFVVGPAGGPYTLAASVPRAHETHWVAQSADGSTAVLSTEDRDVLPGHASTTTHGSDLYQWSGGQLRQLNVLTGGAPISACGARMAAGFEGTIPNIENDPLNADEREHLQGSPHNVSGDGSRIFFEDNCTHHLYMGVGGSTTRDLGPNHFLAANAAGTRLLLFHENGDTAEFLLYETETGTAKHLLSIEEVFTGKSEGDARGSNAPQALIVSEDLTAFYFVIPARLTPDAPIRRSIQTAKGALEGEDLYRYDISSESLRYVAQVGIDGGGGSGGGLYTSPDGRFLYFDSHNVGGLPATDPAAAAEAQQTFRYDSAEDVIECISCASAFDPAPRQMSFFLDRGDGRNETANISPSPRIASDNGDYVFFTADSALVPQDVNGEIPPEGTSGEDQSIDFSRSSDVYEWRADGIDGCAEPQGCLAMITSGREDGRKNALLGTTPSGGDVFFASHSQLVGQDRDHAGDAYDARVDGGFPPPPPRPVECEGDSCSTPAALPSDATPSSLTFSGSGNLTQPTLVPAKPTKRAVKCPKGRRRSHGRCVKRATAMRHASTKSSKHTAKAKSHRGGKR